MIWPDGSWFEKTERKSEDQRRKLKYLERKFLIEDVYFDDISVTKETKIYFSKPSQIFLLLMGLGFFISGLYFYFSSNDMKVYWIIMIPFGVWFIYTSVQKLIDNNPQLILNETGL